MKPILSIALWAILFAAPTHAEISDSGMTCEQYLKLVKQMDDVTKSGDETLDRPAAEVDARINAYCEANPKAKAMQAIERLMRGE